MSKESYPERPILLVDDEEHFLDSMKATLRLNGINNVECCKESLEVMPLLEKKRFSLILLDILMPHIGGEELLPEIVEKYPHLKVIVLTALENRSDTSKYKEKGAFDHLPKPFENHLLIDSIQRALK